MNIKTATKLFGSFAIICILLIIVGLIGFTSTKNSNDALANMYEDNLIPVSETGQIDQLLYGLRGDSYKYVLFPAERSITKKAIDEEIKPDQWTCRNI